MGQLEPGPGEGVGKFIRILVKAPGNFFIGRIETHRKVGGQHGRTVPLARIEGVRNVLRSIFRHPLVRAGRALGQFPLVFEEILEVVVAPLGRSLAPRDFQTARNGVGAFARLVTALPSEALFFDRSRFGLGPHILGLGRPVGFSESVAARVERDGLLVVHRHAGKGLADIARRSHRIRVAVRALGIDINQPHLHRGERIFQLAVAGVALVGQPLFLGTPIHIFLRLPDVFTSAGEAERFEAHRLEPDIAGQNHQVSPGKFPPVFLLDRPKQTTGFVEVDVVRPAVERRETLAAIAGTATAVARAVSSRAVPSHADEKRPVVSEVSRPPVLRIRHERGEILLYRREIKALEFLGVIEILVHRVGLLRLLAQHLDVELIRPPITVGGPHPGRDRRSG